LLIDKDRTAVIAKKDAPGLTAKELAEQVAADAERYAARATAPFVLFYLRSGRAYRKSEAARNGPNQREPTTLPLTCSSRQSETMPRKSKSQSAVSRTTSPVLTVPPQVGYGAPKAAPLAVPFTIHAPASGEKLMSDRAYILINVMPGLTSSVVKALGVIKEIKTIDPCWGKPILLQSRMSRSGCVDAVSLEADPRY